MTKNEERAWDAMVKALQKLAAIGVKKGEYTAPKPNIGDAWEGRAALDFAQQVRPQNEVEGPWYSTTTIGVQGDDQSAYEVYGDADGEQTIAYCFDMETVKMVHEAMQGSKISSPGQEVPVSARMTPQEREAVEAMREALIRCRDELREWYASEIVNGTATDTGTAAALSAADAALVLADAVPR